MSAPLSPSARRSALISALRHPETWPKGFVWNFRECKQCAMGVCVALLAPTYFPGISTMTELLGMSTEEAHSVFAPSPKESAVLYPEAYKRSRDNKVTWPTIYECIEPQMVADRLEILHQELCRKEVMSGAQQ